MKRLSPNSLGFTLLIGALAGLPPLSTDMGLPGIRLLQASLGANAVAGALTEYWATAPTATAMPGVVPETAVTVSVAVRVEEPAVLRVTEKVPLPFVRVLSFGRTADPSELVKCTVPG